jgi:TolB-like protein
MMKNVVALFFLFSILISVNAQDTISKKIVLLPLISNGIEINSIKTAELILRMELSNQNNLIVISEKKTLVALGDEECTDVDCAKLIGEQLNAEEVLICKVNPLGEKLIVQYQLVETSTGKNILSESATAIGIEDLDVVMKRVAISVGKQTPFNSNQEVGNIVKQESIESLRQKARYNFGVGFGYLYPSAGYDNDKKRSFNINAYFDYELPDYSFGLTLGARKGLTINLYSNYLITKTDVCPYVGGALGFHWVLHNDILSNSNSTGDGIEIGLQGGVRLFHTYNFQMFIQGEYIMTFNDYNDKAFVITIGIL